ncbi:TPA: hypothetical protein SFZ51_000568 [Campylobacter jejuni]|nr:hypothetical protein [Campylobacter jejuni]HEG8091004.1 hypothetical protein [Campylobacter jejuni]HEG8094174.1 hypothetical protein [Campylobacter jejuni]HEG8098410.1 hypothetical protein [Campylobacter jejuni]HEG8104697.1 hypothetical protein [Campylobacter jejuni]HEG8133555.1 hypothetical protein [Campylobacter jejuni]
MFEIIIYAVIAIAGIAVGYCIRANGSARAEKLYTEIKEAVDKLKENK